MQKCFRFLIIPLTIFSVSTGLFTTQLRYSSLGTAYDKEEYGSVESFSEEEFAGMFAFTSFFIMVVWILIYGLACLSLVAFIGNIVFSVLMIVDCSKRKFENQSLWLVLLGVGIVVWYIGIPVSLLYYFLIKKKKVGKLQAN